MDDLNKSFLKELHNLTEKKALEFWNISTLVHGATNITKLKEWADTFKRFIIERFDELIDSAKENEECGLRKLEDLIKKASSLGVVLKDYDINFLGVYQVIKYVKDTIADFEKELQEIKQEIEKLNKAEESLCSLLGRKPTTLPSDPIPNENSIKKFKNYLEKLESEIFEREEKFLIKKEEITKLVVKLNYEPSLDFERMIVGSNNSLFTVTDDGMNQLNQFLDRLKDQLEQTKKEIFSLRDRLKPLWKFLNVDLSEKEHLLTINLENEGRTLKALREEMQKCNDLVKINVQAYVECKRKELVELWDMCHVDHKDRSTDFDRGVYCEDLIGVYDLEVAMMNQYYNNNITMFKLLNERDTVMSKLYRLKQSSLLPDRYKNRGGQLLLEEKERKALSKRLSNIETHLLELAKKYESQHRKHFYSWGKRITEIIGGSPAEKKHLKTVVTSEKSSIERNRIHDYKEFKKCLDDREGCRSTSIFPLPPSK
ncbi:hypothetical protein FQR65_LT01044 [Abscondita terminalis]|nr:hypothetical protein FQR65_LT01044 [Abscondita terminalis]